MSNIAERFYVGAYWKNRKESLERCAEQIWDLLGTLRNYSPLLTKWYLKEGRIARNPICTLDQVRQILHKDRHTVDSGELFDDLGYHFGAWNGELESGKSAAVWSTIGSYALRTGNCCVINLPHSAAQPSPESVELMLRNLIMKFDPDFALVRSQVYPDRAALLEGELGTGWMCYVRGEIPPKACPSEVRVEPVSQGTLIVTTSEPFDSYNPNHIAISDEMNNILRALSILPPI